MNPLKPTLKTEWLPLLLILLSIGLATYFYAYFPVQVPMHWNFQGAIDGYGGRIFGAWFMPILMMALYSILLLLPTIDPKNKHYHEFAEAYHAIKNLIVGFIFILYVFTGLVGLGYSISFNIIMPIMMSALFIILGYYSKKLKQNWTMGVRTPWTLENVKVWDKTNRLMGDLMMISGVIFLLALFPVSNWLRLIFFIIPIGVMIIVPVSYSYFVFKSEKKKL